MRELFRLSAGCAYNFPSIQGLHRGCQHLNTVITSLDQLDALSFIIRDRQTAPEILNVQPDQFVPLKQALTLVLARRLGEYFTPALADAQCRCTTKSPS